MLLLRGFSDTFFLFGGYRVVSTQKLCNHKHLLDGMVSVICRMIAEVLLVVVAASNVSPYRERNLTTRKDQ